jgi:hypothetical protein
MPPRPKNNRRRLGVLYTSPSLHAYRLQGVSMAYKEEDVRELIRRDNPEMAHIMDIMDKHLREAGSTSADVTLDDCMTEEEREMAIFAGLLKDGYPPEIAAQKAKEQLHLLNTVFEDER